MIKSFKHSGLENFFLTGTTKGIQTSHADRLRIRLDRLHSAKTVNDMNAPGYDLHKLKGKLKDYWSIRISGNWRLIFQFEDGHAHVVDYVDYH